MRMARGWDVLLSGEHSARGRMDLGGGLSVRGVVRQDVDQGVRLTVPANSKAPSGPSHSSQW